MSFYVNSFIGLVKDGCKLSADFIRDAKTYVISSTVGKVAMSFTGKKLASMILENASEATAYYGLGAYASSSGEHVGRVVGRSLFLGAALPVSAAISIGSDAMLQFIPSYKRLTQNQLIRILMCSLLFTMSYRQCEDAYLNQLEQIGSLAGKSAAEMVIGTVSSFLVIRLLGSEEKLYDATNCLDTYPVKTAQCLAADQIVSYLDVLPTNPLANFIASQIIGSLSFNARDLHSLCLRSFNGTLLEESDLLSYNFFIVDNPLIGSVLEKLQDRLIAQLTKSCAKFLTPEFHEVTHVLLDSIASHFPRSSFTEVNMGDPVLEKTNKFLTILLKSSFNLSFSVNRGSAPLDKILFDIDRYLESYNIEGLLSLLSTIENFDFDSPFLSALLLYFKDPVNKSFLHSLFNSFMSLTSPKQIKPLAHYIFEKIEEGEIELTGLTLRASMSSDEKKELIHQRLYLAAKLAPLGFLIAFFNSQESLDKKFFKNVIEFMQEFYSLQGEFFTTHVLKKFINHQIDGIAEVD